MADGAASRDDVRPPAWHAYRTLIGSRIRAQTGYRTSFVLDVFGSATIGFVEFAEVYVIFHNIDVFGGLDLAAVTLMYGLANIAFSLAALVAGNLDRVPDYVRTGTLDVLLLRPLPLLGQLVTDDFPLRRLGRAAVGVAFLAVALTQLDLAWTPATVFLLAVTPVAGAAVFAAVLIVAGAAQFWLLDGTEFTSAFTYGSAYAATIPAAVFPMPVRVFFSFVLPASFIGYLPTLAVLDLPGPAGLPSWLGWLVPVVAVLFWLLALATWRSGLRRYTGAGG